MHTFYLSYFYLDELLPIHLRIAEGISWTDEGAIASGWINTMRVASKIEFIKDMSRLKLKLCDDIKELNKNDYIFDPICPKMINLHDKAREKLAVSDLVRDHRFIFLVNMSHLWKKCWVKTKDTEKGEITTILNILLADQKETYILLAELLSGSWNYLIMILIMISRQFWKQTVNNVLI